ncbi:hypothetical protein Glove_219g16 [Diversispora epigaea]|uniref:Uncharacterized protein n=1 Tax=Diversispora epigaea TaxID=1348612 RepID=A0A397INT9_9GLOM|nr:hypothetical protein Glove_219g16 [Diversispora epigaea]
MAQAIIDDWQSKEGNRDMTKLEHAKSTGYERKEEQHNEILKNAIVRDRVVRTSLTEHLSRKWPAKDPSPSGDLFQPDISNTEDDNCLYNCDESDNVSTEFQRFITKMKGENHRLFEYRIVNLSEKS